MRKEHGETAVVQPTLADVQAFRELQANDEEYRRFIMSEAQRLDLFARGRVTMGEETMDQIRARSDLKNPPQPGSDTWASSRGRDYTPSSRGGAFVRPGGSR